MLKISPVSNYGQSNVNFKSNQDRFKSYKGKEKLGSKMSIDDSLNIMTNRFKPGTNAIRENWTLNKDIYKLILKLSLPAIVSIAFIYGLTSNKKDSAIEQADNEKELSAKTDSLYNLYKGKTIKFNEFREELNKLSTNK